MNSGSCTVFIRASSSWWAYTPCTPMSFDFNVERCCTYHNISPYQKFWKRHTFNLWYSLDTSYRFTGTFEKLFFVTISNPHSSPTILKQKWFKNFSHISYYYSTGCWWRGFEHLPPYPIRWTYCKIPGDIQNSIRYL